jgi:hypothetical protein
VQAVFEDVQVFVPGAEQGFDVRSDLDTLLHSVWAVASARQLRLLDGWLDGADEAHAGVIAAKKGLFGLEVEPAGMLARKVQATAIENIGYLGGGGESMAGIWRRIKGLTDGRGGRIIRVLGRWLCSPPCRLRLGGRCLSRVGRLRFEFRTSEVLR